MTCLRFSIESLLHNPIGRLSVIWTAEGDCKRVYIKGKGGDEPCAVVDTPNIPSAQEMEDRPDTINLIYHSIITGG